MRGGGMAVNTNAIIYMTDRLRKESMIIIEYVASCSSTLSQVTVGIPIMSSSV